MGFILDTTVSLFGEEIGYGFYRMIGIHHPPRGYAGSGLLHFHVFACFLTYF